VITNGTFTVRVTVAGCQSQSLPSAPVTVTVNPAPIATITPSGPTNFCQGGSVTLTANPAGGTYLWSNGAITPAITVTTNGTFTVRVTVAGCQSQSLPSAPITVTVNPLPIATITPSGPTTFCQGDSVTLTANPAAGFQFAREFEGQLGHRIGYENLRIDSKMRTQLKRRPTPSSGKKSR